MAVSTLSPSIKGDETGLKGSSKSPGEVTMFRPSDDWELKVFLVRLSDEITSEEFEKMKCLLGGLRGVGQGILESVKTILDYFRVLQTIGYLNRYNLLILQTILWHIGRLDLHEKLVEFAQNLDSTLHFFLPAENPENGYKHVKFHIRGASPENYTKEKLEEIRGTLALYLCIPASEIAVAGIEPAASLLLTFLIPAESLDDLCNLARNSHVCFGHLGIDLVMADGIEISLVTSEEKEVSESQQEMVMKDLLLREKEVSQQLECATRQVLELEQEIQELQRSSEVIHAVAPPSEEICLGMFMSAMHKMNQFRRDRSGAAIYNPKVESLKRQSSLVYLKHVLRKVRELGYDPAVIETLIDANSTALVARLSAQYVVQFQQLNLFVQDLQQKTGLLQYENEKLKFYRGLKSDDPVLSSREEFLLNNLMRGIPGQILVKLETTQSLHPELAEMLRKVTKGLSKREKLKIKAKLEQRERDLLEKDSQMLFEILLIKESSKNPALNPFQFIVDTLVSINRRDLIYRVSDCYKLIAKQIEKEGQTPLAENVQSDPKYRQRHGSGKEQIEKEGQTPVAENVQSDPKYRQRHGGGKEQKSPRPEFDHETAYKEMSNRLRNLETLIEQGFAKQSKDYSPFSQNYTNLLDNNSWMSKLSNLDQNFSSVQ